MELRVGSLDFSLPLSGSGPRTATTTLVFPRPVLTAAAGLAGYTASFTSGDHHIGRAEIRLETSILTNTVTVSGTFGLRDWSGNWDDPYNGTLDFAVVAELEPATGPGSIPPRTDLAIVDMELNQATQFFRTNGFLDPATTQPNNSVFMIARKDTGIRVYIDWDSTAGLPPISRLTGTLIVQTGSTMLTLQPINPLGAITPHRDITVNQALANDTLNFMIPAAHCVGTITVTCRVFDQNAPDRGSSGAFTRSITFTAVDPLRIFLVGVGMTTPATAAPSEAAVAASLLPLRQTYPRGDIEQTGFTTITLTQSITGCPTSGCGDGFHQLMDMLRDLRGGSGDIYFGGLPAGVGGVGGNCVIGCSPTGDRVGAAFIDFGLSIPHEVGHALGRRHARCVGCSPPAQNPDPDFPQYGSFPSDSIGVFGFDPTTNTVFNPASALDFMTAFLPLIGWVSPYTYRALLAASSDGGGVPGACTVRGARTETLFLRMTIDRDGKVVVGASFHHDAVIQGSSGCDGRFTIEFLDSEKKVLDCAGVGCGCESQGCGCWPKSIRQPVRFPKNSKWMLVWDGDKKIHEEPIPDAPTVKVTSTNSQKDGMLVSWTSDPGRCWYLVQWFDEKAGVWRGVAPRQQTTSLLVPIRLFSHSRSLKIRVLATEKIATGYHEREIVLSDYTPPNVTVGLGGFDTTVKESQVASEVLTAIVRDSAGRKVPADNIIWYNSEGSELGRGESVDLRQITRGQHVIRVVVRGTGGRPTARSWFVEHTSSGVVVHHAICDSEPQSPDEGHKHPHPVPKPCDG